MCSGSGQGEGVVPTVLLMHLLVPGWPLQRLRAPLFYKHCRVRLLAGVVAPLCGRLGFVVILSTGFSVLAARFIVDEIADVCTAKLFEQGVARRPWRLSGRFSDHGKSDLCSKQGRELVESS